MLTRLVATSIRRAPQTAPAVRLRALGGELSKQTTSLNKQQTRELLDEIRMRAKKSRKVQFGGGGGLGISAHQPTRVRRTSIGSEFSVATSHATLRHASDRDSIAS